MSVNALYSCLCCLGSGGEEDEADLMPPPPRQKKRVNQNVSQSTSSASLSKSIIQGRADIRVSSAVRDSIIPQSLYVCCLVSNVSRAVLVVSGV